MRQSCTAVLVLSIALLTIGCQQTPNASSQLTPLGTLAPAPQLAPVSTTSTGTGPFGGRTRIAPPGTGSYAVPNNYMGGTAPVGQLGVNQRPLDSFSSNSGVRAAAFAESASPSGVAPTSFGAGFAPQPTPLQPQLGGMRVHDLTGAPSPPGYRTEAPVMMQNQPIPRQAPGGFAPSANPNAFQSQPIQSAPRVPMPNRIPGADIANQPNGNRQVFSIAERPDAVGVSSEAPIQPSPMQPSFNGASQFQSHAPSTEPVNNGVQSQSPDLPWRRPTAAY